MAPPIQPVTPGIRFFDPSDDTGIAYTFAIIISRYKAQWIWVRHNERDTWELPAGHLEKGENALEAAHRELYEETGALEYTIEPIVSYEGIFNGRAVFGKIFFAHVTKLGPLPDFEIREINFFNRIPEKITYPEIQPIFFTYTLKKMDETGFSNLTALENVGITLAEDLIAAGIKTPQELFELGTEETFQRIRASQPDACISKLYAIEGAIQGIRWHALNSSRREQLRQFYNQLNPSSF